MLATINVFSTTQIEKHIEIKTARIHEWRTIISPEDKLQKSNLSRLALDQSQKFDKESKFLSVCFKILLNYMQLISIIGSFDLKWPFSARQFFQVQGGMGTFSTQFFSIDCLAKGKINKNL